MIPIFIIGLSHNSILPGIHPLPVRNLQAADWRGCAAPNWQGLILIPNASQALLTAILQDVKFFASAQADLHGSRSLTSACRMALPSAARIRGLDNPFFRLILPNNPN
ncbi:MAG: hypothetical protein R2861_10915 [Desulfobacterales bacterium]